VKLRLRLIWGWCSGARKFWQLAVAALHGSDETERAGRESERGMESLRNLRDSNSSDTLSPSLKPTRERVGSIGTQQAATTTVS
jgi:hypothetical protein